MLPAAEASLTVTLALSAATLGATFTTVSSNVVVAWAPSLSVAVMVTVWLSSGPSAGVYDQVHVPLPLSMIEPTEAARLTVSLPTSP